MELTVVWLSYARYIYLCAMYHVVHCLHASKEWLLQPGIPGTWPCIKMVRRLHCVCGNMVAALVAASVTWSLCCGAVGAIIRVTCDVGVAQGVAMCMAQEVVIAKLAAGGGLSGY